MEPRLQSHFDKEEENQHKVAVLNKLMRISEAATGGEKAIQSNDIEGATNALENIKSILRE